LWTLLLGLDNGCTMLRPIQANQDGRLYAIGNQGLQVFVDYLGGLRLSLQTDNGSLLPSMVLSAREAAGLRELLNHEQPQSAPVPPSAEPDPQGQTNR
jgi:hypothetical protein